MVGAFHQTISIHIKLGMISLLFHLSLLCMFCEGIGYKTPYWCGSVECPSYEVIHSQEEFEIRQYKVANWLSTPKINTNSFKNASEIGFKLLLKQGVGITAPIITDIYPSTTPSSNSSFVMYLYLSKNYRDDPAPSKEVQVVKLPPHKFVAVKRFGGFVDDNNVGPQLSALKQSLKGTTYQSAIKSVPFSVAIYNPPFDVTDRVNEVLLWFD